MEFRRQGATEGPVPGKGKMRGASRRNDFVIHCGAINTCHRDYHSCIVVPNVWESLRQ
jgi:hypothetical protein